jgi:hypothetical protein
MVFEILKTKLETLNTDCEDVARSAINDLYACAKYDGSRFVVPSFDEAAAVLLNLIAAKERAFLHEIDRVLRTPGVKMDFADFDKARELILELFAKQHYLERLRIFSEGIARRARGYGQQLDLDAYGAKLAEAAYRAGVMNAVARAQRNVIAELELHANAVR